MGSVPTRMGAAGNACLGRHWGTADSAITPNTTFLLLALSGQVTKLQQLSGHALPFAPLGHAPTMVPGEHLLCSPKAGCALPDPPCHLALMKGFPSSAPFPVPVPPACLSAPPAQPCHCFPGVTAPTSAPQACSGRAPAPNYDLCLCPVLPSLPQQSFRFVPRATHHPSMGLG